ncbi:hypothetical protein QTP86_019008 [Hemibagrus guttatus]|nr:hypothetical protein QTP86_019008 [Hemibagrus guttatus]
MDKCKDLSKFDKGQIVKARRLDQSISKTAALVWCSQSAVVSIYQKYRIMHRATKMVQEWFDEHNNGFEVLTWPPNSPDINLIEHLWDVLHKQL